MNLSIRLSAREDLAGAFAFYEQQEEGLGTYFFDNIFSDIDSLASCAGIHQKVFGYHRLLSKRFPYAIYYSVRAAMIDVVAVLDCRRDPAWIREQLK
jgi:plasmid stabilization system protein ParE